MGISIALGTCAETYSLQQLFALADQNNKSITVSNTSKLVADEALESAKAQRLPEISSELGISYNGKGFITDRDFSNFTTIDIPEFGNSFTLKVNQVIYSGGAISTAIRMNELGQQMAQLSVEKNRQEVRFVIVGQYLDLYKLCQNITVLEKNISLAEKVLQNMHTRYDNGTALKNDITRYELQLANLRLQKQKVEAACRILSYQIATTVGLPEDTQIQPTEDIERNTSSAAIDQPYWQQQAATGNYGLQQASLQTQMSQQKERMAKAALMPKLMVFAEDYLNGPITIEIPAINKNFNYWYVGVGLQYNLSSLFKNNHDVKRARRATQQANEELALAQEKVRIGVQAAVTNCHTAAVEVDTQQKSVQLAEENYSVVSNRYNNDLALLTDMLDASNIKLSADLKLVEARINQLYCEYQLRYLAHQL